MKPIKTVSLIGLGAIGGVYAPRLHEALPEGGLSIIASGERKNKYEQSGIILNGKRYDFNYVDQNDKVQPADLLIIAVKYYNLDETIKAIKNHVGPDTIIMSLLNGIDSEEILGTAFGMQHILYSFVKELDATREGNNIISSNKGKIVFGEKDGAVSQRVLAVKELFDKAEIGYVIPDDILAAQWWKFVVNCAANSTSAILHATYQVYVESQELHDCSVMIMREAIAVAIKLGINLNESNTISTWEKQLPMFAGPGKSSMLQDIEAGRKTENDMLCGKVVEFGKKLGVPTPVNQAVYYLIKTAEFMNGIK